MDARGAGGSGLPRAQPRCAQFHHPPLHHAAARNRRCGASHHGGHPCRTGKGADRGRCLWPRQEALLDLAQDAGEGPRLLAPVRHLRLPRDLHLGTGLLPDPGRHPPALARRAGPVQGLHQPAEIERLPVDPHHRLGPRRQAGRGADPHPPDARGGRGRRGRALVLPRWRARAEPLCRRSVEMDRLDDRAAGRRGSQRLSRKRQTRDVSGSGVLLHAQGGRDPASPGGHAAGLCLCHPHPDRELLRLGQGRRHPGAAVDAAEEWPVGGNHHRRRPDAAIQLDRHRHHRPRQGRHPQKPARRRPGPFRQAGAGTGPRRL